MIGVLNLGKMRLVKAQTADQAGAAPGRRHGPRISVNSFVNAAQQVPDFEARTR
jgi:hypothetical protein